MSAPLYGRLPGVRRGVFTRASAWRTADYILLIDGSRFQERYRRVYFRDILGMMVTRRRRIVVQAQWIALAFALLIAVLFLPAGRRDMGLFAALLADAAIAVYLYLAALSYSCRLYIATAVGNVFVPSVFRVWQARRFMAAVEPAITEAQSAPV